MKELADEVGQVRSVRDGADDGAQPGDAMPDQQTPGWVAARYVRNTGTVKLASDVSEDDPGAGGGTAG
ncbi:hypothetical protein GCM10018980_18360 [Streptomyces capoamus]|uniref:Uncharacterized protein n=1 Tax=Streptomyces capoamus TaxID=68183 RepID=A0A919EUQ8_9ACTN|nr:hypothetical protein GCM10010501_31980 [Streptomyces libani subsp. rufus]GHG42527.1 hypothetical protein GCM10018980_18360 [Streptomyces capoamus]